MCANCTTPGAPVQRALAEEQQPQLQSAISITVTDGDATCPCRRSRIRCVTGSASFTWPVTRAGAAGALDAQRPEAVGALESWRLTPARGEGRRIGTSE